MLVTRPLNHSPPHTIKGGYFSSPTVHSSDMKAQGGSVTCPKFSSCTPKSHLMEAPFGREEEEEQKSWASAHRYLGGGSGYHILRVSGRPEQSSQRRTAPEWQMSMARADVRSVSTPLDSQARSGDYTLTPVLDLPARAPGR